MQPNYANYESAARAIYEPQKQAEATALGATRDMTKNTLESQKGQVNTDYQSAVDNLTQAIQDQTGQINQLYSQRLGGNFSGLQGNDLGNMYGRANQQRANIESTRANKLAEITTGQTNADIAYGAGMASLEPKYQSMETQYAQNAYGSALKDYQDQLYKQQQLQLSYARLAQSAANRQDAQTNAAQAKYKVTGKLNSDTGKADNSQGYAFTGPGGTPISLAEYVAGSGGDVNTVLDLLQNGSAYDRAIYNQAKNVAGNSPQGILNYISYLDKTGKQTKSGKVGGGNYYGF